MKKIFTITMLLFVISGSLSAQNNVVKTGLLNVLYGEYQLGYERMINESQSLQLKAGYFQPISSFFIDKDLFRFVEDYTVKGVDGGFQTSFEYRFYMFDKEKPAGFYVAPYARYTQMQIRYSDIILSTDFNIDASAKMVGVGAQMGIQWLINDRFCIDFNFFGSGIDLWLPRMIYKAESSTYDYSQIKPYIYDVVDESDYIAKRMKFVDNGSENLKVKLPLFLPGYRFGLSVGYAF